MVFSSTVFLFCFLPLTLIGCYIIRSQTYRNAWLLIMSLVFFGWSQPQYLWIIVASIIINYLSALFMSLFEHKKKAVLFLAVVCNLLLLFYYKYLDFSIQTLNDAFGISIPLRGIILPIGISFFTFQGMSYVIDVFKGDVRVQKNPLKVALYIVLFPQLVAGPIVRYIDIENEIDNRNPGMADFSAGITRFVIGLSKKAIIANTMAEVVDTIWDAGISNNTVAIAWLGSIAYSLQIFYDFSGYSDMAIGIGRMLGFHFCENFNRPYISKNITEFWRRWHISLSSWFRDYVYIPLGGNRKHLYRNLIIVFMLTGLWHGASWHFVIWGAWNGFFIVVERLLRGHGKSASADEKNATGKNILRHIYALFVINTGWVLFRADNFALAMKYIGTMFGIGLSGIPGFKISWYVNNWVLVVMAIAVFDIIGGFTRLKQLCDAKMPGTAYGVIKLVAVYGMFLLAIMRVMSGTYNPFIYFQF
ncbi:MBOAT family protein [Butyrivibrio sp. INlla16]|uniref:MBOAT family O-acyltransferase n=1 Tax=Butyrivibrio sp. INlla16 TaxID=1520807 RepID=UPI00089050B2|nr:MBOAT family O-acyltransferase [Butyrivibrio sp. INlla16]SDB14921.1 alginate O-acetyltransferase complex protein AlgI [Butyrivibrio sp. INlla16]